MKFLKIVVILAIVILTVVIGAASPKLHKPFVITGANFVLDRYTEKLTQSDSKVASPNQTKRPVKIEPSAFLNGQTEIPQQETDSQMNIPVENSVSDNIPLELQEQLINFANEMQADEQADKLSKREELIAWNKWRSNVQNEVMMGAQVEAPIGTMFYFSFKVDKFRHISNIKAYCTNPSYNKEVQNKLIPIIKKMEYTQILEFPKGSQRDSTTVRGMFGISDETVLAHPDDFHDLERVQIYE